MFTTVPDSRAKLVDTGAELIWRAGYSATSPREVMQASGVGQGSFYHHFPTKADLGVAAIEANAAAIISGAERALLGTEPGIARLRRYLLGRRDGVAGCKIGGLTYDPAVFGDPRLLAPIDGAFRRIGELVDAAVRDGQRVGDVRSDIPARDLTALVIAAVQGGFVLSRARRSPGPLRRAAAGAFALLDARGANA